MDVRYANSPTAIAHLPGEALRHMFLVDDLFIDNKIQLTYTHHDRLTLGGAVSLSGDLVLENEAVLRTRFFRAPRIGNYQHWRARNGGRGWNDLSAGPTRLPLCGHRDANRYFYARTRSILHGLCPSPPILRDAARGFEPGLS